MIKINKTNASRVNCQPNTKPNYISPLNPETNEISKTNPKKPNESCPLNHKKLPTQR